MRLILITVAVLSLTLAAHADSITKTASFSGMVGGDPLDLAASATFDITGNTLTITLTNTATSTAEVPTALLAGVFWSFGTASDPTLTPVSAVAPEGIAQQPKADDVGPGETVAGTNVNVGGESIYDANTWGFAPGATQGVAVNGFIGGAANFNGPNLDDPSAPNGMNFGMVPGVFSDGDGNGGMDREPFVKETIVFTLTGVDGLVASRIDDVTFAYGTNPNYTIPGNGDTPVPEPGTLALLGAGAIGLFFARRRLRS